MSAIGIPATSRPFSGRAAGFALLLITTVSWGLNWPLLKYLLTVVPPFTMRTLAGLIGAGTALTVAYCSGERLRPPRSQWWPLIVSSVLNFTSFMTMSTLGLLWLSASESVIMAYTLPLWTALIAWPVLGERPQPQRMLGLAVGFTGIVVLMGGEPLEASWAKMPGFAIIFVGSWMFALGTVLAKRSPVTLPPIASVGWQVGIGSTPLAVPALFEFRRWHALPAHVWAGISYLGLVGMCVAYLAWFAALRRLPASTAAIGTLIVPVVGVFGAVLLLGEPLGGRQIGALGLTLAGVGLAARS
ncbi:MAG: DMT family transporter [Acidisphaera sp.]|nr:DMT family transporter [Acidisphaera sp.]